MTAMNWVFLLIGWILGGVMTGFIFLLFAGKAALLNQRQDAWRQALLDDEEQMEAMKKENQKRNKKADCK